MKIMDVVWPVIGLVAVAASCWLLYNEIRGLSLDELMASLTAIPGRAWGLSFLAALAAYAALAYYDRVALMHLGRQVSWWFVTVTSFTTYALSHNIGASVFSGAVVRYRAYRTQGLSPGEIGVLVALCSFTFALGTVLLAAILLLIEPQVADPFLEIDHAVLRAVGVGILLLVGLYALGSWLQFKPLKVGGLSIFYPRLPVVVRQIGIAPVEIAAAAAIIYFALPAEGNPGYLFVLGVFLISFSIALISHAPGGLGVLEYSFILGLSTMDEADVLAALIVFRLLYLLIPFVMALVVVLVFERRELVAKWRRSTP